MRITLSALLLLAATVAPTFATTIAQWTFETTIPTTAGPLAPEVGSGIGTALHASGATVYSNPVGNGSVESWSSNTWAVGDYYRFQVSTLGLEDIVLSWEQTRSSTGPSGFNLRYGTDGSTWTNLPYTVDAISWSSVSYTAGSAEFFDLSAITALDNQATVCFQLESIVGTAAAGTNRVDNFTVTGTPLASVPEGSPGMAGLAGVCLLMAVFRHRGKR